MLEQLIQYDKELFLFLNGLGNSTWDGFWMFYTTKFYWIPLYALLIYLIYKKKISLKPFLLAVVVIALMVLVTDQVTNIFKHGFERYRPCHDTSLIDIMRIVKEGCGGRFGYFSGHSSNSMAVAVFTGLVLRNKYKYLVFIMLFWAALMGYSRIYIGVHFPLDVISGFIFGAITGFSFYKLDKYLEKRFKKQSL
ncbi:phosphatase PAP2 family protein [uncultured Lacinutrix sp.]|uniref:phosphatase PAP2 family protein n=1 Tax=uncultured Lacinutrix sp. TaxID=574032 RepID=UPI00260AD113|nr:phosphatase PAP2 family protein [uncultured Lacinutrix sp.]